MNEKKENDYFMIKFVLVNSEVGYKQALALE